MIHEVKLGNARALVYSPETSDLNKPLPVDVFYPGMGENDDGGPITLLYKHGPLHFVNQGWAPKRIIVGVFDDANFPSPASVEHVLTDLLAQYPQIHPKKVYAMGLSAGASTWYKYMLTKQEYADRIAGAVLMSSPQVNTLYKQNKPFIAHKPIWAFHGTKDTTCKLSAILAMYEDLKANNPKHFYLTKTDTAHGPWNPQFDPKYGGPLSGLSIYHWLASNNPVK